MPGDPAPIQILVRNASTGKDNTAMQDNTVEQNNSSLILPGWTRELPEVSANGEAIDIRKYGVRFGDDDLESVLFFPMRLLQNLFEEEVLSREIELLLNNPKDKDDLVRQILGSQGGAPNYLKIFTILKLMRRGAKIRKFIEHGICDQDLPLRLTLDGDSQLCRRDTKEPLSVISDDGGRVQFDKWQYSVAVPFFDKDSDTYDLHARQILPYYKPIQKGSSVGVSQNYGGFGVVSKIIMHPLCYNFHSVLGQLQSPDEELFFALKELNTNNPTEFEKEVKMLRQYNGKIHEHLVTLLAAFNHRGKHFLLFPWATCDLLSYLEKQKPVPDNNDPTTIRWISYQAWKLVQAVECIHSPPTNLQIPRADHRYGRHGDLKPENILWFKGRSEQPGYLGFGNLVISDMGLSEDHRFYSRSNIPNKRVQRTPRYRPPECDYKDGKISRAFDIWTLGCIFLDLVTWLLGGYPLIQEMEEKRTTVSIRGDWTDEYFEWVKVEGLDLYTVRLKQAVTECIATLRGHPKCTRFVCDFLDIIENNMLVAERNKRAGAAFIQSEMSQLYEKSKRDSYCVNPYQRERNGPLKSRLVPREFGEELLNPRRSALERIRIVPQTDFQWTE